MTGIVTLVGAGPGDPDLLTVGALRALQRADVVVHDHLVCPDVLALAESAQRIDVGKLPFGKQTAQETINGILVREGSLGRNVVRLKGGDPFMFGRGTEELEALHRAGIPTRVIPGVSSLNGVLASAGVSLTARGRNQGFAVFSAAPTTSADEIRAWAGSPGPVIVFMGAHRAAEIEATFTDAGWPADMPVTVIARGCTPRQRVLETTLVGLGAALSDSREWTPALLAIGLGREHAMAARPLDGRVAVIEDGRLDSPWADLARALGAQVARRAAENEPEHPLATAVPQRVRSES